MVFGGKKEKYYVLDTNILLHDPDKAFSSFNKNGLVSRIVIPLTVIDELEEKKKDPDPGTRANARKSLSMLKDYRSRSSKRLSEGVEIDKDHFIETKAGYNKERIDSRYPQLQGKRDPDTEIIKCALDLVEEGKSVELVTDDNGMLVRADTIESRLEVNCWEDIREGKHEYKDLYKGWEQIPVSKEIIGRFYKEKYIIPDSEEFKKTELIPNKYFILKPYEDNSTALCKYDSSQKRLIQLYHYNGKTPVYGIMHKNVEQFFALNSLLDSSIECVCLIGEAGTGKTLASLAAGFEQVVEPDKKRYSKVLVIKPIMPIGHDIGFLPGEKENKLHPWMMPIIDNIEFLHSKTEKYKKDGIEIPPDQIFDFMSDHSLEFETLLHMRGRSLHNRYIIVDDAQNTTMDEIKTIMSRVSSGSKVILTGDPMQIDAKKGMDVITNGLSYVSERFKGDPKVSTVILSEVERSYIATLAARVL